MANDALSHWLHNAGREPMLTKRETIELARIIQAYQRGEIPARAGNRAIDRMVKANLRLVAQAWRKRFSFIPASDPLVPDMLQEGALNLRRAAEKYDPETGYSFSTYAMSWIVKGLNEAVRDIPRTIRVSPDCYYVAAKARHYVEQYAADNGGRKPSLDEVAKHCKKNPEAVRFYLERYVTTSKRSLDAPAKAFSDGDETSSLGELVADKNHYDQELNDKGERLRQVLDLIFEAANLDEKERTVLVERNLHGDVPMSYDLIGALIGRRGNHVHDMQRRIIKRLQKTCEREGLTLEYCLSAA